ncbi:MAG TPA: hypothetical protein PKH77_20555 [Anaerolineae bacterium]|nr:hypothetical protein [Anaerolineae bacterium]
MTKPTFDIWQYQIALSERLMQWAGFNLSFGAPLSLRRDAFWQGFGMQCGGWGLINGALAWFGKRTAQRNAAEPRAHTPEQQNQERRRLAHLLWVNAALDVLYIAGGLTLAGTQRHKSRFGQGNGWGIAVQGAALLLFDLAHALPLTDLGEN